MSLAVSPLLTQLVRSDTGADPAARALQALLQLAGNTDAPLEALVKAVSAGNLTTLAVNGETLQVRLPTALPVGTVLTMSPVPDSPSTLALAVKPSAPSVQPMAPASAQTASAAVVSVLATQAAVEPPAEALPRPAQKTVDARPPTELEPVPRPETLSQPPTARPAVTVKAPAVEALSGRTAAMQTATTQTYSVASHPTPPAPAYTAAMAIPASENAAAPIPRVVVAGVREAQVQRPAPVPQAPPPLQSGTAAIVPPGSGTAAPQAGVAVVPNTGGHGASPPAQPLTPATPSAAPPTAVSANLVSTAESEAARPAFIAPSGPQALPVASGPPTAFAASPLAEAEAAVLTPMPAGATAEAPELEPSAEKRLVAIPYPTAPRTSTSPAAASTPPDLARAAAIQQPLAPMLADAVKLAADPAMPPQLRAAAQQVVAQALDPQRAPLDATALRQAVEGAGVLRPLAPLATPDLVRRLTSLRGVLSDLLGDIGAPEARHRPSSVPLRGDAPHAERSETVPAGDEAPRSLAHRLLGEADGALSRLKLLQAASMPADGRATDPARPAEYRVEVPMLLGREATIIQFVLEREAQPPEPKKPRGWRMRFALNVAALGEVGADISILGQATQVSVWAQETETAALIEAMLPDLAPALKERGLEPGSIRMRHGRPGMAAPGRLLDNAT